MIRRHVTMHTGECPTCGESFSYRDREEAPNRPFCSRRCREIDLGKWLNEEYRVCDPVRPNDDHLVPPETDDAEPVE